MAETFEDLQGSLLAIEGPEGSTIVSQRNKVALDVLRKALAAGKTKIAIFYGAGHMPDMEQRLAATSISRRRARAGSWPGTSRTRWPRQRP